MSDDRPPKAFASAAAAEWAVAASPGDPFVTERLLETLRQAESEAATDGLTRVANRRGWQDALADEERRCERYGHPACVVAVDLDGFKAINDTRGHGAGDQLLVLAAERLHEASRTTDVVARVGGDEFAVLAVDTDRAAAQILLARLGDALREAGVEASLGLGERTPADGLAGAWAEADRDMYEAKRRRALERC